MKKDILFLDANILFSAAYSEKAALIKLWQLESVTLVSSVYAIEEAKRNLDTPEQLSRLEKLLTHVEKVPFYQDDSLLKDIRLKEKDRPILLAAIFAQADYLITGDKRDFGPFYGKKVEGVIILPPSEYFKKVEK